MFDSRKAMMGFGLCALIALPAAMTVSAPVLAASALAFDTDKDGTLDLAEAKAAAGTAFDAIEKDSDGTLDKKEAKGYVSKSEFAEADTDKDGSLTKDEYLTIVEKLFKAADTDGEGTLSAKELKSKAGKTLTKLLK